MALVPVYQEITVHHDVIHPGSVYNELSGKYTLSGNCDNEVKRVLKFNVECTTGTLIQALRETAYARNSHWLQDLGTLNSNNIICVKVNKICERAGKNIKFCGKPVITSVQNKCESKLVLFFSQAVDVERISYIKKRLEDALYTGGKLNVHEEDLDKNFLYACLYEDSTNPCTTKMKSLEMSLERFCEHMIKSKVHNFISTATVQMRLGPADGPERKKVLEQRESMPHNEPLGYTSEHIDDSMNQKHETRSFIGSAYTTSSKDLLSSVGHLEEHVVPSTGTENKVLNLDSQSNDQKSAQSQQCQLFPNNDCRMKQFHKENVIHDQGHHNLSGSTTECSVEAEHLYSDSDTSGVQPLHNKTGDSRNGVCYLYSNDSFQDSEQFPQQIQSKSTSCKIPVSSVEHPPTQYKPKEPKEKSVEFCSMEPVECIQESAGLIRKYFGIKNTLKEEKVIILIGGEGSGKTELIDFAANCLKGNGVEDSKYFVTKNQINEHSHTCSMTAYTFCFDRDNAPITIIDTPELEDIKEIEKNYPLQTLKTFLTEKGNNIKLHAFGYVIPFHAVSLNSSERHIIDFITANFGQEISTSFITFVTFATDDQVIYPIIDIFKGLGIKSKMFLNFNNSFIMKTMMDDFYRAYWKLGIKNWKKCVKVLRELPPLSFKSFRAQQEQIYSTCLMKSVETQLRNNLKAFILSFRKVNGLTQSIQERSEQVWKSAAALYHLRSVSDGSCLDVERVLIHYAEEVARETSFPPKKCVMLLSLCPSQGLLEAGKRIVYSMKQIFDRAKACESQKMPIGKALEYLFCKKCKERHKIERGEGKNNKHITYHCLNCKCDEDYHVECTSQSIPQKTCYIHTDYCLKHTRGAIEKILQEYSIPGYVLNIKEYLEFISCNVNEQYKDFITSLSS